MPRLEAIAAVTFSITNVKDGLLCEFEKIITELAAIIAKIIAQVKYPNIFLSYIWFSLARSNHVSDNLLVYRHFSMIISPTDVCSGKYLSGEAILDLIVELIPLRCSRCLHCLHHLYKKPKEE
jgi:hypothetical protein